MQSMSSVNVQSNLNGSRTSPSSYSCYVNQAFKGRMKHLTSVKQLITLTDFISGWNGRSLIPLPLSASSCISEAVV